MTSWPEAILSAMSPTVLEAVTYWVAQALAFGTALALLTWLLTRTVFRRTRPALHSALWMIVLAKFLLPAGPAWSMSLASAVGNTLTRVMLPEPTSSLVLEDNGATSANWIPITAPAGLAGVSASSENPNGAAGWSWLHWLGAVYLVSVGAVAAVRLASYLRFSRACRGLPPADSTAIALVHDVCARLGVRRVPSIHVSDDAPAPFVLGALHPMLVLSRRQLVRPDELEAVVLHEVAHFRRGDLLVRYVQWIAGTLLFFWPVVAWVNRRIDLAREVACDEWALSHGRLSAGEYARCLLRALAPVRSRPLSYCPAAMAANVRTVERRIEMILETPKNVTARGSLGVAALVILAAWAAFVLGGAASADEPKEDPKPQTATQGERIVAGEAQIVVDVDGAEEADFVIDFDGEGEMVWEGGMMPEGLPPHAIMFAHRIEKVGDGPAMRTVMFHGGPTPKQLASFAESNPTADANGDGAVSQDEYHAYLIALAMKDPAAVMTQYPKADRNKDGKLSADEAAWMVHGFGMIEEIHAGLPPMPEPEKILVEVNADDDAAADDGQRKQVVHRIVRREAGQMAEGAVAVAGAFAAHKLPDPPSRWLLDNVGATPTAREVAGYIAAAQDAPLAHFLKMNPDADTNRDGRLTAAERDEFLKQRDSRTRAMMLKIHPEADTNGDGVLSDEEARDFRKTHLRSVIGRKAGGMGVVLRQVEDGDADAVKKIVIELEATDDAQCEEVGATEDKKE